MTLPPDTTPAGYWPDGAAATAYPARVESLLKARGLDGTDRRYKTLMRRIVAAFQARDMAGVTAGCEALVDAIEDHRSAEGGTNGPDSCGRSVAVAGTTGRENRCPLLGVSPTLYRPPSFW